MVSSSDSAFTIEDMSVNRISPTTGSVLWSQDLTGISGIASSGRPIVTAPKICGRRLLIGISDNRAADLICLSADDGSVVWKYVVAPPSQTALVQGPIYSEAACDGERIVVRTGDGLTMLSAGDGKLIWNVRVGDRLPRMESGMPLIDGSRIYLNSDFGVACALDIRDGKIFWRSTTDDFSSNSFGGINQIKLSVNRCTPLLAGKMLLIADGTSAIYGVDAGTGKRVWKTVVGFPFRFDSAFGNSYVLSTHGFQQIDPATGRILHFHGETGGAWYCHIGQDRALITRNPIKAGGWEELDLHSWKTIWQDASIIPYAMVDGPGNLVFVQGRKAGSPASSLGQRYIWAYRRGQ